MSKLLFLLLFFPLPIFPQDSSAVLPAAEWQLIRKKSFEILKNWHENIEKICNSENHHENFLIKQHIQNEIFEDSTAFAIVTDFGKYEPKTPHYEFLGSYLDNFELFMQTNDLSIRHENPTVSSVFFKDYFYVFLHFDRKFYSKIRPDSLVNQEKRLAILKAQKQEQEWEIRFKHIGFVQKIDSTAHKVKRRFMELISPKMGEIFDKKEVIIEWKDSIENQKPQIWADSVDIELWVGDKFWKELRQQTPNEAKARWKAAQSTRNDYRIGIRLSKNRLHEAFSPPFGLVCDTCSVFKRISMQVSCDNTELQTGDKIRIEWQAEGIDWVKIELLNTDYKTVACMSNVRNKEKNNAIDWQIPYSPKKTQQFIIRISDAQKPDIQSVSPCSFRVKAK